MQALLVLGGQRQRIVADVRTVHPPLRVVVAHGDGDAARPGAQVQGAAYLVVAQPRLEAGLDHLRNRRTRHQCARIGLEAQARKPCLAGQVRGRNALLDAAQEQAQHLLFFRFGHARIAVHRAEVMRQVQRMQGQLGRFVQGVVVAVAEGQPGRIKAASAVADQVDDGLQFFGHGGRMQ